MWGFLGSKAAQRVALQLPPRRAAQDDIKKGTISRAEGGQLQAPVGPCWLFHSVIERKYNCIAARVAHKQWMLRHEHASRSTVRG